MNCQSFENIIDDLAREQLIEASAQQATLRHCDDCPACAMRLGDGRMLTLALRALANETYSAEAPERVKRELLLTFGERQFSQNRPRLRRFSYMSAAAAVLLVGFAVGIAAWNWRAPAENPAGNSAMTTPLATEATPSLQPVTTVSSPVSNEKDKPANSFVAGRKPAKPGTKRRAVRQIPDEQVADNVNGTSDVNIEVATDFMPLGYVNSLSLQDGGSVVRVELPRSTIVSMGFAVNMDRYGERVKADVLMGADGLARAIRFVQ